MLEATEDVLRELVESAPDAMVIVGEGGRIVLVNGRTEAMFGYRRAELVGQPVELLVPERLRLTHSRHRRQFQESPKRRPMGSGLDLLGRRKDGSEVPVEISLSPLHTPADGMMVYAAIRDVTERRRSEEAQARLAAIVESSEDAIYSSTLAGQILSWNRGAQQLLGFAPEEIIGQGASMLMPSDRRDEPGQLLGRLARGELIDHHETVRRRKDGALVEVSVTLSPIRDRAGAVVGASSIARDIRAAKAAERRLLASLREKEVLLKEVHHRVKNNLQVISSLLRLQGLQVPSSELQVVFEETQNRIGSIALLHEKLYRSSDLARIDLGEYLRDLATNLIPPDAVDAPAVKLELDVESAGIRLGVDQAIPCGLIANELVTNCLKHAFRGRVGGNVWVRLRRGAERDVHLVVEDDGCGVPPSLDLRNTQTLGLQLVNMLVDQLEGTLELERGHGTRVEVTFAAEP